MIFTVTESREQPQDIVFPCPALLITRPLFRVRGLHGSRHWDRLFMGWEGIASELGGRGKLLRLHTILRRESLVSSCSALLSGIEDLERARIVTYVSEKKYINSSSLPASPTLLILISQLNQAKQTTSRSNKTLAFTLTTFPTKQTAIMKVTAVFVAALATLGAASPPKGCTPGTYSCTPDAKGWQVCDVSRAWVVSSLSNKTCK